MAGNPPPHEKPGPVRLALVITELDPGGAERCLVNLATRINRQRFEPVVYSIRPRPVAGRDLLVQQLEAAGVGVRFADVRSKWQAPLVTGRLARLLAEQRPQIVQNFLYHANVAGTLAAARLHVPHVCLGVRVADPRRVRSWIERRVAAKAERIVCVSHSVAEFCRAHGFPPPKLDVIPNGVDVQRFADATAIDLSELGLPPGRKAILFVGRLHVQKELHALIAAAPPMLEQLPEHDLLIVGDGPQRKALVRLAAESSAGPRIHFAGWRADIPRILAAADLLVLPSRWEGMPNVILEAMAAGKPVVATRAEGVQEALGPGAQEQMVATGDMPQFTKRVIQVLQAPQLAQKLGRQNRQRAIAEFSLQTMVSSYERLYARLVAPL
jgi:glycosyltransferase involved in cell wall biosynthesis